MLSLITICKNRLQHLKQTLPLMLKQSLAEVIVVDYGCEEGTAAWVKANHSKAKVVRVTDDPVFSIAIARNTGARIATREYLCFVDADLIINQQLGRWLKENRKGNGFYVYPVQSEAELSGFAIVPREQFFEVGCYDEAFRGWGGEDKDLYERLERIGLSRLLVPKDAISSIPHGNELRQLSMESGGHGSLQEALAMNQVYRMIKRDFLRLTNGEMALEHRKELVQLIRTLNDEAKLKGEKAFEISIGIPVDTKHNRYARSLRKLIYKTPVRWPAQ